MEEDEIADGFVAYADDGEDDEFNFSTAQWSKKEETMTAETIRMIEEKLYSQPLQTDANASEITPKEGIEIKFIRRRCTAGYSAHSESVDDKETSVWQKQFAYLRILGTKIVIPENLPLSDLSNTEEPCSSLF